MGFHPGYTLLSPGELQNKLTTTKKSWILSQDPLALGILKGSSELRTTQLDGRMFMVSSFLKTIYCIMCFSYETLWLYILGCLLKYGF